MTEPPDPIASPPPGGSSSPDPAEVEAVVDLLAALEYGKKKEETALIDAVFSRAGIARRATKVEVASQVARSPGFEPFFLAVVGEVRPFAQMLGEVYAFLGRHATVGRRASTFRVTTAGAEAVFDFSLDAFPKHLVRLLTSGDVEQAAMALALPDAGQAAVRPEGRHGRDVAVPRDPLVARWQALHSIWDNDFYDSRDDYTSFFRLASYASLMRQRLSPADWVRVQAAVEPVIDRLAALVDTFEAAGVRMQLPSEMRRLRGDLGLQRHPARSYTALPEPAPEQLALAAPDTYRPAQTFGDLFDELARGWAVAVHLWRTPSLVRTDDGLEHELPPDTAHDPARYADVLVDAARALTTRLDDVAPIVDRTTQQLTVEQLIEFTELPFWKHRWFLYELWTLVRVLDVASTAGPVTLEGLSHPTPGVQEWVLPGGMAKAPVARISGGARSVSVWTQLKTQHPETQAGLEPDLRIQRDQAPQPDIFLIENKDRLSLTTGGLARIVARYVTGTEVRGAWFINYEDFPDGAHDLEAAYPARGVRVVSQFRPGQVPADFEPSLLAVLQSELQAPAVDPYVAVTLEWTPPPEDLDLHAWVERAGTRAHVFYGSRGSLHEAPHAAFDEDQRTGGVEQIVASVHHFDRLVIAVHRFSPRGAIAAARATVSVAALDAAQQRTRVIGTLAADGRDTAEWWHVLEMDGSGAIRRLDVFGPEPPLPR